MAGFLNISVTELIEKCYGKLSENRKQIVLDENKRKPCPFLKGTDPIYFCEIYPVRPEGCELFPMETDGGRADIDCQAGAIAILKLKEEEEQGV